MPAFELGRIIEEHFENAITLIQFSNSWTTQKLLVKVQLEPQNVSPIKLSPKIAPDFRRLSAIDKELPQ